MTKVHNPTLLDVVEFEDTPEGIRQGTVVGLLGGAHPPMVLVEVSDSEGVPEMLAVKTADALKRVVSLSGDSGKASGIPEALEAYEKGLIFLQNRLIHKAKEKFSMAFASDPKLAGTLLNATSVLVEKGGFGAAILIYQLILELRPEYKIARDNLAATFVSRGIDFARRGLVDRAIDDFNSALLVKPSEQVTAIIQNNLAAAYTQLGLIYTNLKQYQEATGYFVRAFEIRPFEATAKNLGMALIAHFVAAGVSRSELSKEELFKRAMQIGLTLSECLNAYGATLALLGWTSEAQSELESAIEADPENELARANLSCLLEHPETPAAFRPGLIPLNPQPLEHSRA